MRTLATTLAAASLVFAGHAFAASHMEKGASAPMAQGTMMKKDAACGEMVNKNAMMKKEPTKK